MVGKRSREEFERDGVDTVREQVKGAGYADPQKQQQAIRWLNQQDPARKTLRAAKKQLELARPIAREMRITLLLSAVTLAVLILALAKLWHG